MAFTVNEKGGRPFRKYTKDTFEILYSTTRLGANYELSVVIEGLIFISILTFYAFRKEELKYFEFVLSTPTPSLGSGIRKLKSFNIFPERIIQKLERYQKLRNDFIHDPFRLKTMKFNNHSIESSLEELFNLGMDLFHELNNLVFPKENRAGEWKEFFKGTIEGTTIEIKLGEINDELNKRGFFNRARKK